MFYIVCSIGKKEPAMKALVAIDVKHPHADLVEHLGWLLPLKDSSILLLFVDEGASAESGSLALDAETKLLESTKSSLERLGASVEIEVLPGIPELVISRMAETRGVDVTVVAPESDETLEKLMSGSVSSKVANSNFGTTIILRNEKSHGELRHVLFGLDCSINDLSSIRNVASIFRLKERGVKVTIAHVIPEGEDAEAAAAVLHEDERDYQKEASLIFDRAKAILEEMEIFDAEYKASRGEPASELLRLAEESDVQLIVNGDASHSELEHFLSGSVSSRIISCAPCSVAIARAESASEIAQSS